MQSNAVSKLDQSLVCIKARCKYSRSDNDTLLLDGAQKDNNRDIKEYLAYRLDLGIDSDTVCGLADKSEGALCTR